MSAKVQFRLRLYQDQLIAVGPGKVALLEAIGRTGSISAAARELGMSYRRAWLLIDETNRGLKSPAVETAAGGAQGGGTQLTDTGAAVIRHYRAIEAAAYAAAAHEIGELSALLARPG